MVGCGSFELYIVYGEEVGFHATKLTLTLQKLIICWENKIKQTSSVARIQDTTCTLILHNTFISRDKDPMYSPNLNMTDGERVTSLSNVPGRYVNTRT